ncbi:MAG: Na+/H+ antiporter NhaA, partial [Planctomycetota bacterium]|jgi:NhaA family Na+:H+ antiporter
LEYLEHALHPWVGFVIMPVFALANAGVPFHLPDLGDDVAIAVMAGLVIGKPLGIVLLSWLAVKLDVAMLPKGVTWGMIVAGGCLAGIGFTMALFIASLALEGDLLNTAKIGVLAGSLLSAIAGMILLVVLLPKTPEKAEVEQDH